MELIYSEIDREIERVVSFNMPIKFGNLFQSWQKKILFGNWEKLNTWSPLIYKYSYNVWERNQKFKIFKNKLFQT